MTKSAAGSEQPAAISSGLRRYLYATAGITGAAILIVEILGAKMLAPYVGTSHFVWTAQIAVTLISLATGYYLGGWMVDRAPRLDRLYLCIAAAAVYLALSIPVVERVAYAFLHFNLALGALLASAFLFFVPLTLLAAVGPFLIRVLALSLQSVGGQVGRLSAISTLGSVAGTLLIGYALLPFLPNSVTMFLTAGVLVATALGYFLLWGKGRLRVVVLLAAVVLAGGGVGVRLDLTPPFGRSRQIYRANSDFGMLQVVEMDSPARRYYLNDFLVQNTYDPVRKQSTSLFTYMLRYLAEGYTARLDDVLCIGLGVGIVPRELAERGARVQAVEINPAAVEVARAHFDFPVDKVPVAIGDGRYFLKRGAALYDAVVLDAFLGDSSPSHLMTREAFEEIKRVLRPEGVLVINSFGDLAAGKNFLTASLQKTLSAVFASVRTHATGNGNVFFVASARAGLTLRPVSVAEAHPDLQSEIQSCLASNLAVDTTAGRLLTDDFNPADFYDAENRESHRRRLAFSIRRL